MNVCVQAPCLLINADPGPEHAGWPEACHQSRFRASAFSSNPDPLCYARSCGLWCRLSRGMTPAVIQSVAFSSCSNLLAVSSARGTTHMFRLAPPRPSGSSPPQPEASPAGKRLICAWQHIQAAQFELENKPGQAQLSGPCSSSVGVLAQPTLLSVHQLLVWLFPAAASPMVLVARVQLLTQPSREFQVALSGLIGPEGCADEDALPAHLAAGHSLRGPAEEVVQLTACSRVRPAAAGLLNGTIPGSAAAAAAVNLYTGAPGEPCLSQDPQAPLLTSSTFWHCHV